MCFMLHPPPPSLPPTLGNAYMPSDVAAFARESMRPDGSPTQAVLQDFIVRGITVDNLFLMLSDMGHAEGMKTIEQYGEYG